MMWRTLSTHVLPYLNKAARFLMLQLENGKRGLMRPRWEECVKLVQDR